MELFQLLGKVAIDTSGVDSSISTVEKKLESLGTSVKKAGDKIASIGGTLSKTVTAGITALGVASVKSSLTFEDAMAKVSTIADTSKVSIGDLESQILALSDQTGISASDIADNVYNAISAGQDTADAVNFVSNATKLATAGFADSADTLDILSTIMNAYGMEAKDVTKVSDMLIQTQNKGKTTVAELSASMGKVIPTANAFGVSLDEVCTGYALMTSNGIATAESTTYMNGMLNELGKSGTTVSDILKEKTGQSFSDLMAGGSSLGDVLAILQTYADETGVSMADLWGSAEAGKAALVLAKDGAEGFNSVLGDMQNSSNSTSTAFEQMETTSYKLKITWNEVKNTLIDLGNSILEVLMPYIEAASAKVKEFTEWFKGLDDETKQNIVKFGLLVAAIGPVLVIFGKVISIVGSVISIGSKLVSGIGSVISIGKLLFTGLGSLFSMFGTVATFISGTLIPAIAAIGAPVWIVIGAITALIAIGVALYKNWDDVAAFGKKCWQGLADFFSGVGESIGNIMKSISDGASKMKDNVVEKASELKEKAADHFNQLKERWSEGFSAARDKIVEISSDLKEKAGAKISEFKDSASEKITNLKDTAVSKFNELRDKGSEAIGNLKDSANSKFSELGSTVSEKFTAITSGIQSIFEKTRTNLSGIVDTIKGFFNFDWKLPDIKLPHFKIDWETTGAVAETLQKIGMQGLPKIGVDWYAKAMNNPIIMDSPTAFGINKSGQIMAGGDAGSEVVSGTDTLMNMIKNAVNEGDSRLYDVLTKILTLLSENLPGLANTQLVMDTGAVVGELAEPMNEALGNLAYMRGRRN